MADFQMTEARVVDRIYLPDFPYDPAFCTGQLENFSDTDRALILVNHRGAPCPVHELGHDPERPRN